MPALKPMFHGTTHRVSRSAREPAMRAPQERRSHDRASLDTVGGANEARASQPLYGRGARHVGRRCGRLCRPARLVGGRAGSVLALHVGLRRHRRRRAGPAYRDRRRQDARRPLVPRCQAQLRREPAAPAGRGGRAGLLGRGPGQEAPQLHRPLRTGLAHGPGAGSTRGPPGGPGCGLLAEHAGNHRLRASHREPRRRLVVVLVGFRHARCPGPLRPDRTQGADRRRRLLLWRQDLRPPAAGAGDPGRASHRRACDCCAIRGRGAGARRRA